MKRLFIFIGIIALSAIGVVIIEWKMNHEETKVAELPESIDKAINWSNPMLENYAREACKIPEGDIYIQDLSSISRLCILGNTCILKEYPNSEVVFEGGDGLPAYWYNTIPDNTDQIVIPYAMGIELSDLKYFTGLEILEIYHCGLDSIAFLEEITSLKTVSFEKCELPQEHLKSDSISYLYIMATEAFLSNQIECPQLIQLHLDGVTWSKGVNLNQCKSIQKLGFTHMHLDNLIDVSSCVDVDFLDLSNDEIESLNGIEKMSHLSDIVIYKSKIMDANLLTEVSSLRNLTISDGVLEDALIQRLTWCEEVDIVE